MNAIINSVMNYFKQLFAKKQDQPVFSFPKLPEEQTQTKPSDDLETQIKKFINEIIETGKTNPLTKTAYANMRESSGKNRSKDLDPMILRNGGSLGDPYCLWGQQDIFRAIEKVFPVVFDLPDSGSTQKFIETVSAKYISAEPVPYGIGIYKKRNQYKGHAVMALSKKDINGEFATFEFNTDAGAGKNIERDGQGCYFKTRDTDGYSDMSWRGCVDIFKAMKRL